MNINERLQNHPHKATRVWKCYTTKLKVMTVHGWEIRENVYAHFVRLMFFFFFLVVAATALRFLLLGPEVRYVS